MLRSMLRGAMAGAAGTTALNAVTYLDMAFRGRPSSSTPEDTVEKVADELDTRIPGSEKEQDARKSGLGALLGIAAGTGVGAAFGLLRGAGLRLPVWLTAPAAGAVAMAAGNGPMVALGVTDPRSWSSIDWLSDVVPHLAYGAVTALALEEAA
ncbi:MAG: hypothetical protein JO291_08975 [Acidimicrobiia bacterium]|nr:hypothetical protein [Acidimicrobiia bacterium]